MQLTATAHLAYCTNVHPAETWEETFLALKTHALKVRSHLREKGLLPSEAPYALGMRLSARAAQELLNGQLDAFQQWLKEEDCYVFTINGFPYGAFHNTRVKEQVYAPDWTTKERLSYTLNLFEIISALNPADRSLSVSTLPGSFKEFKADELQIFKHLETLALAIEKRSVERQQDLHLGLEPEPLGHFENLEESIAFFDRLTQWSAYPEIILKRVGINYDTCHFALEYEDCEQALRAFKKTGIRISKVHLSNALALDGRNAEAVEMLSQFNEPTYLHQVLGRTKDGLIERYRDLPEFFKSEETYEELRCHFHIPLYEQPIAPLSSTLTHAEAALQHLNIDPRYCPHFEIETYTWQVLPNQFKQELEAMITAEYEWTLGQIEPEHRTEQADDT